MHRHKLGPIRTCFTSILLSTIRQHRSFVKEHNYTSMRTTCNFVCSVICVYKARNGHRIAQWFRHARGIFINDVTVKFHPVSAVVEQLELFEDRILLV